VPCHRASGFGRYVAFRTAVPRHAARPARRRRLTPLLVIAGLLGTLSTGLLAMLLDQPGGTPEASVPQPRVSAPSPGLRLPPPYRFQGSSPRAVWQAAKPRPDWRCHHDAP